MCNKINAICSITRMQYIFILHERVNWKHEQHCHVQSIWNKKIVYFIIIENDLIKKIPLPHLYVRLLPIGIIVEVIKKCLINDICETRIISGGDPYE